MKKVLIAVVVILVLIQFIRPEKNSSIENKNDISTVLQVPEDVKEIIKTSCADCHTNNTKYPWYSEIAPVSWYLAQHVNEGKEHLNFSEWAAYNKNQRNHVLKDIIEELTEHEMPLESYLILHKDAKLSDSQYSILVDWAKTLKVE